MTFYFWKQVLLQNNPGHTCQLSSFLTEAMLTTTMAWIESRGTNNHFPFIKICLHLNIYFLPVCCCCCPNFLYAQLIFSKWNFVETSTVKKSAAFSKNMLKEFNKSYFSNPHLEMPNIDHGVTLFFKWLSNIRLDRSKCNPTFSLIMLFVVRSRKTNSKHKALSLNWVLAMFFFNFNAKSKKRQMTT